MSELPPMMPRFWPEPIRGHANRQLGRRDIAIASPPRSLHFGNVNPHDYTELCTFPALTEARLVPLNDHRAAVSIQENIS